MVNPVCRGTRWYYLQEWLDLPCSSRERELRFLVFYLSHQESAQGLLSVGHSQPETAIAFSPRYCIDTFPWTSNTLLSLWDSYPIEPLSEHHHIHEGHEAIREHLEWAYKDGKGSMGEVCEVWLRSCGLFGSKKRRQTGGLMAVCSSFKDNHDRSEWTPGRMMKFQRRQAENKQLGRCPTGWHLLEFILMLS